MTQYLNTNLVPQPGKATFITEDVYIKGGMRSVATRKLRDAIPVSVRKAGMLVYVADMSKYYSLNTDLTSWSPFNPGAAGAGTDAATAFGVMEVVSVAAPAEISSSWFPANSVGAFDVTDCPTAPNFVDGDDTEFMGLHFGVGDGARMLQMGFGIKGGTDGMFIRAKASATADFGEWIFIEGTSANKSLYDLRPSSRHTKAAHGFVVGTCIAVDAAGAFIAARADSPLSCEVVGFCTDVVDENVFELTVPNVWAKDMFTSLTPGHVYYVSGTVAGELVDVVPVTPGFVSKPVLVAVTATSGILLNQRGVIIPEPASGTNVSNLDTTTIDSGTHLLVIENNFGAISPLVQVQDNAGFVRNDVKIKVTASDITFDFTSTTGTIAGTWKAVVYA